MLPRFRRGAFLLFALSFVATMLLGDSSFGERLLLAPDELWAGRALWRPVTALFAYPEASRGAVVVTLGVQWAVAGRLEEFWGTRRYLVMAVVSALAGYGAFLALATWQPEIAQLRVGGPGPLDIAAATAFAIAHGRQVFRPIGDTPVGGRLLGFLVALAVFAVPFVPLVRGSQSFAQTWPLLVPLSVAALSALIFVSVPRLGRSSAPRSAGGKAARERSHLRVVRGADDLLN